MRWAFIHRGFRMTGGTERYGLDLAAGLLSMGDEVHLIARRIQDAPEGAVVHRVPGLPVTRSSKRLSFLVGTELMLTYLKRRSSLSFDGVLGLGRTLGAPVIRLGGGCHRAYLEAMCPGEGRWGSRLEGTKGRLWTAETAGMVRAVDAAENGRVVGAMGAAKTAAEIGAAGVTGTTGAVGAAGTAGTTGKMDPSRRTFRNARPPRAVTTLDDRLVLSIERRQLAPGGARAIIAVSHRVKEELELWYGVAPERVFVIHNGVDTARFCPSPPALRRQARGEMNVAPDSFTLLFVGNGLVRKGWIRALEAFTQFAFEARRRGYSRPLRLLAVGRDVLKTELDPDLVRRLRPIDAKIKRTGELRTVEVAFRAADGLLLPTLYDPFANVTLEAISAGVPVISTPANGASELVATFAPELIMAPDDLEGQVRALIRLLDDDIRTNLGKLGRAVAKSHTNLHNAQAVREVLREYGQWSPPPGHLQRGLETSPRHR